jgi:ribosomal protein L18
MSEAVFEREDGKYGSRVKDAPEGATQGKHEAASPTPTN